MIKNFAPNLTKRRNFLIKSAFGLTTPLILQHTSANAADPVWPSKPIRLVVPYAPGGSSEMVARAIAVEMSAKLGQNVFVENKAGAAGSIAMQEVAKSEDGHTVILGHVGTMIVNPLIQPKLSYDPIRDFSPIALLAKVPAVYVVHPDVQAQNLSEFIALAQKKPGQLTYGSAGNASGGHLAFEYLKMVSDTDILHVPYKGTGPLLIDLMAGRLQAACVGASALMQFIKSGKLRAIAVSSDKRLPQLPNVATVAEQGFKGFEFSQWYGLLAPSRWPKAQMVKLEAEAVRASSSPNVTTKLLDEIAQPMGSTSEVFRQFIQAEQARWKPVVSKAQIKSD